MLQCLELKNDFLFCFVDCEYFGDGHCGAGEIHTRVRAKFRGDATRGERLLEIPRAHVYISPGPQSPSPKLETTRSLSVLKLAILIMHSINH